MKVLHWQATPTHLNKHRTSQAYTDDVIMMSQYKSGPNVAVNLVARTSSTTSSEVTGSLYTHLKREQMEVLYNSKCNRMKELEQIITTLKRSFYLSI